MLRNCFAFNDKRLDKFSMFGWSALPVFLASSTSLANHLENGGTTASFGRKGAPRLPFLPRCHD
jgi:hypothetical protein